MYQTKTEKMKSTKEQLAKQKVKELKKQLSFELKLSELSTKFDTRNNELSREQNIFLLNVQIQALESNIN